MQVATAGARGSTATYVPEYRAGEIAKQNLATSLHRSITVPGKDGITGSIPNPRTLIVINIKQSNSVTCSLGVLGSWGDPP